MKKIVTYQEKFEELRNRFAIATDRYIKANQEVADIHGFFDKSLLENLSKAKNEFQNTGDEYHSFLSYIKREKKSPNDIYTKS
jgi:hypothetical protein